MKTQIILLVGLIVLISVCQARPRPEEEEYDDYEDKPEAPAPPPKKVPGRPNLLGRRNQLIGRNAKPASSSTTKAPEKEAEEVEEYEEVDEEQIAQTSSTTESAKKFIKGGIVRPFRSNDDLLASLKRRREQAGLNKHSKVVPKQEPDTDAAADTVAEPAPKSTSSSGRRRFNTKSNDAPAEKEPSANPSPARSGRRFHARN